MIFTIMMLASSASSLSLCIGAGHIEENSSIFLVTFYFAFMLVISRQSILSGSFTPGLSWTQYISIPHYGFTALLHNELLGQNFCPEHKTAEINKCQNVVM
ncbi:hypothetical protein LEMLEM_LOCUS24763 [Lemmus lemmus]